MLESLPPQFVNYYITGNDKIPCDATGSNIDPHNPANWKSLRDVQSTGRPVAFVLSDNDPYFLLDLDKCRDGDGWSKKAVDICAMFPGAAMEVSTSGNGIHILGRCDKVSLAGKRKKFDGWLECYRTRRLVAFGPYGWSGNPDLDHTRALQLLVPDAPPPPAAPSGPAAPTAPDEMVLARLLAARSGAAMFGDAASPADLWYARSDVLARFYPPFRDGQDFDHSSADAALLAHLAFWCAKDAAQMDRLFRQSGLMRPKYAERDDYRNSSLRHAISNTTRVADWSPKLSERMEARRGELLTIPEQIKFFEGCVYVAQVHRILTPTGEQMKPEQFNVWYGGYEFIMSSDGSRPTRRAFEAFTENRAHKFPKVSGMTFDTTRPYGEVVNGMVNVYRPANVAKVAGDVTPFLNHLTYLLPDENDRSILLNYMAHLVQNPGVKYQWAPVIQGAPGNGKTFLTECMIRAIGEEYCHLPRSEELSEKYNGYLVNKLFLAVEEVHLGGRREMLNILKPLITNNRTEIRMMGVDKFMAPLFANWWFTTNHKDAIIKEHGDRRYAMFFTAQQDESDVPNDDYFRSLYGWANGGGYAAIAHYLQHYRTTAMPARAPRTTSTDEAINESYGVAEQLVLDAIADGKPGFRGGWVSTWAASALMVENGQKLMSPRAIARVLRNCGYSEIMRAPTIIMSEGAKRPRIYANSKRAADFNQYLIDQGYQSSAIRAV